MTTSELAKEVFSIVEAKVLSRPSPAEFEMAYQIRVAIEKIRFAVKATEQFGRPQELQEAGLQLVEALDRLQSADRAFQRRLRTNSHSGDLGQEYRVVNGSRAPTSREVSLPG